MQSPPHFSLTVAVIGDESSGVGRLLAGEINQRDHPLAASFKRPHLVDKVYTVNEQRFAVRFVAVPMSERHLADAARYTANAAAVMFVCSAHTRSSFERLKDWVAALEPSAAKGQPVTGSTGTADTRLRVVVCNTTSNMPTSTLFEVKQFAAEQRLAFYETSTRKEEPSSDAFYGVVSTVSTSIPEPMDPSLLIGQRIKIERQLLEQPDFQRSLFLEA